MNGMQRNALFAVLWLKMACAWSDSELYVDDLRSSIRMLALADWGGNEDAPYTTPSQRWTAGAMGVVGEMLSVQTVLALGDNFYHMGINGTCESERFDETWNKIYTADSLMVPWLVNAGNHDHVGNISAQIAYTEISDRWIYPALYHKRTMYSDDRSVSVDVIMMDTVTYTGVYSGTDYPPEVQDTEQHVWVEEALKYSTADYIIVGAHYPMYSACSHGNTLTMLNNLKPLLEKYNAHMMNGHDHCAEHFVVSGISYWLNGIGHGCCYNSPNKDTIPPGAMRYLLSNENATSQIDDDGFEIGVNGTVGGFSSVYITKQNMTVRFHDQNGTVLYSSWVPPRNLGTDGGDKKLDPEYVIIICVGAVGLAIVIALMVYFLGYKKWAARRSSRLLAAEGVDEQKLLSSVRAQHTDPLLADEGGAAAHE